jgi:hypothetical protein
VRRYRTERRGPSRATALVVGALVVAVAVIVVVVLSLGGGKGASSSSSETSGGATSAATQTSAQGKTTTKQPSSGTGAASTTSPGQLNVVVLNGTTTTGLAHHVSEELQQRGYTKAAPLTGQPPGANQTTVVEYASGHRGDAQRVARSLGLTQAQPIEGTVASMAGSASVVVIVGLDKA